MPGLASIQGLWAPIALGRGDPAGRWCRRSYVVHYGGDPLFTLHFAIAMLAYSLFIVATMHAVVMLAEEKWLHRGVMPPFLRSLPPLLEMEALLFRILFAAFVLLTLTVVSGVFFSEQLFDRPFQVTHKTVFGIISWVIFGCASRGTLPVRGWRGQARRVLDARRVHGAAARRTSAPSSSSRSSCTAAERRARAPSARGLRRASP